MDRNTPDTWKLPAVGVSPASAPRLQRVELPVQRVISEDEDDITVEVLIG